MSSLKVSASYLPSEVTQAMTLYIGDAAFFPPGKSFCILYRTVVLACDQTNKTMADIMLGTVLFKYDHETALVNLFSTNITKASNTFVKSEGSLIFYSTVACDHWEYKKMHPLQSLLIHWSFAQGPKNETCWCLDLSFVGLNTELTLPPPPLRISNFCWWAVDIK